MMFYSCNCFYVRDKFNFSLFAIGLAGFPLGPIYSGCKHAIVGLTRSYGVGIIV